MRYQGDYDRLQSTRRSREVWVAVCLIEDFLSRNDEVRRPVRVVNGIDPQAKIVGVRMVDRDTIALLYDRPVNEPSFQTVDWTENRVV
jgi:hypothetical protein